MTVGLLAGAVLAIGALVFSLRGTDSDPTGLDGKRLSTQSRPDSKAGRVQDRLSHLRDSFDRRQLRDEVELSKSSSGTMDRRPEIPTPSSRDIAKLSGQEEEGDYDEDDYEEVKELRDSILNDPDPEERVGSILMLSGNEHPEAVATLLKAMGDRDKEVRLAAVEALGDYTELLQPSVLAPALDDEDPEVRFEALGIVGDMETPEAMEMVRRALDDPNEDVRALAEGILDYADEG
jgi:HEAT repeat protein